MWWWELSVPAGGCSVCAVTVDVLAAQQRSELQMWRAVAPSGHGIKACSEDVSAPLWKEKNGVCCGCFPTECVFHLIRRTTQRTHHPSLFMFATLAQVKDFGWLLCSSSALSPVSSCFSLCCPLLICSFVTLMLVFFCLFFLADPASSCWCKNRNRLHIFVVIVWIKLLIFILNAFQLRSSQN